MGTPASKMSLGAVVLEQPQLNATRKEWMRSFKMIGVTVDTIARKLGIGHSAIQEMAGTEGEFSNSQNAGRNVYKEVAIMWKNEERSVD
jgi:hypothetical protein